MKVIDDLNSKLIAEIAYYHATEDKRYINDISKELCDYPKIYMHFSCLKEDLNRRWNEYKGNLSVDWYLELGKSLFKIYQYHGVTFSTEDLSDNLIFKYVGE